MLNPRIIGFIVFILLLAGAFAGWMTRQSLPAHQLADETKNLVSVSVAVIATVSALVLGLLISNANNSFSVVGGEVTALSAQILRLDQMLHRYGPDTKPARETLRHYAEQLTTDMFPDDPADFRLGNPATYALLQRVEALMLELNPANPREKWWLDQAMTLAARIGDTRWLLTQQLGQGTPKALLALLVFWLVLLFASFGLFAPPDFISAVTLTLCALAVAGAVGMIPELEKAFGGLVHISPEPMRQAVKALKAESNDTLGLDQNSSNKLSRLLKAARHSIGLEQIDLARAAGIDPNTLSMLENCNGEPVRATSANLEAVLNALRRSGVEIEDDGLRLLKRTQG